MLYNGTKFRAHDVRKSKDGKILEMDCAMTDYAYVKNSILAVEKIYHENNTQILSRNELESIVRKS